MTEPLSHDWFIDRTLDEIDRLAWIADGADPAKPVATCPGWTISKLVKHTGTVHRWATEIVSTRSSGRVDARTLDLGLPGKESDYAGWLADGAEPLAAALRDAGPDTPVWAWGASQVSGWWARRMLYETTMHRADLEITVGESPQVDPVTAADGIDEFLTNLPTATRPKDKLAGLPAGESLHLHATDDDNGEWLIRFTGEPGGVEWERGHAKATTAVRAPAAALLLFTCGRVRASDERFTVFGKESLLASWQEKTAL